MSVESMSISTVFALCSAMLGGAFFLQMRFNRRVGVLEALESKDAAAENT